MNFVKKIRICLVVGLVLVFGCSIALANPTVNIVNLSGGSIYIYDTGGSTKPPLCWRMEKLSAIIPWPPQLVEGYGSLRTI